MPDVAPDRTESKSGDLRGVLPAGTTLRGYELKSILGQGAFGITYRARDLTLNRDVAIKEYLPTTLALREGRTTVLPRSPDHAEQFAWGRERFLEEARTLAKLDRTPSIVRVHDFLEDNGTAYMVMGLVEGEPLSKRLLREGRLTPEAAERLLFPLLDGLEEVHGIGFLHRDIKPANVMVDARGRPTLIDFGAARAAMAGRSTTMTAIFTPGYAAAEQYTSAELGPWTDVYGLAATLYHAITGKIPPSSIERIIKDTYEPLSELKPEGYAPELLAGIDAGMARHVEERPQGIAQWRHVLRTGERQASAQEVTQVEHRPRRRSRKSSIALRGSALWASAAAVAVLLAGGTYLAFTATAPVNTAVQSLSAEQLERALAERRKADAFAAEKQRLEQEARQKAEADGEAKRQADAELEQARQARQKAEQELAELKARIEAHRQTDSGQRDQEAAAAQRAVEEAAQRKAEADAAALRQAEEEAQKKAEAEAEAKRQADEALAKAEAERQRAEQEARAKAGTEQAALRQASQEAQHKAAEAESVRQAEHERVKAESERAKAEADRQKAEAEAKMRADAEAAEKALRLDQPGRERLQVALTSLGFDTRGSDGILGPRTREMISAWQKARNQPVTGFVTAAQQETLLKEAALALAKHDEQKKAEEEAKARLAPALPSPGHAGTSTAGPSAAQPTNTAFDGTYSGDARLAAGFDTGSGSNVIFSLRVANGRGTGTINAPTCSTSQFSISVSPTGAVVGEGYTPCALAGNWYTGSFTIDGKYTGGALRLAFHFDKRGNVLRTSLRPSGDASPPSSAAQSPTASPAPGGPSAIPQGAAPPGPARPAEQPDASQQTTTAPIQTSVLLQRASENISSCRLGTSLAVRLYPNRIEVQMIWGWEAFKIDADGSFSGSVSGPGSFSVGNTFSRVKLSIQGNARSKVMRIESLDYYRCAWSGIIS